MRFAADLLYAVRLLARRPAFTALVAFTLALGIGATTAIFSVVNPILFESLPYPAADRLTMLWERQKDGQNSNVGFSTFADLARELRTVESMAAMSSWQPTFTGRAEPERLEGQRVSPAFLKTLGVRPAFGRDFHMEEDVRGAPRVAILSHALWHSRFGGDSSLVGKEIALDGNPFTVLGVMPETFENVIEPKAQLYTLLRYNATLPQACRSCRHLRVVARLAPGATLAVASSEIETLAHRLFSHYPTDYGANSMAVQSLNDQVAGGVKPVLLAVLGAVGLVLLIACANVTNLLLARGVQRQGEFAVRAALGASRRQLIGQLMVESVLLALLGGALGIGVAELGVKALVALSPANLPRLTAIEVNNTVLLFTFGVTALVGLAFGLVPAIVGARSDLHLGLKAGSRRATGTGQVTRAALVVGEVAVAVVLLVGAGLLLRSVGGLLAVSPGFDADKLLTVQVQSSGPRFQNDTVTRAFFEEVLAKVRAVPGVISVGATSQLPLSGDFDGYGMHIENRPATTGSGGVDAFRYSVSAGYLDAMRIPIIRGRGITDDDRAGQPPVVLINETAAKRVWAGMDPIGQRVKVGDPAGPWRTIVGIVGDVRHVSLAADKPNGVYTPESQWNWADGALSLVIRTRGDPMALVPAVRTAIWSVDKDQPIVRVASMSAIVEATAAERRFALTLFEAFAAVALVLAAAGIYGVLSGMVTERWREIGVRAALGAARRDIVTMIVRQGIRLAAVGALLGVAVALATSRVIRGLLYGVTQTDPVTYVGVVLLLGAVALVACWIPAWRASRVDPAVTLRSE